MFSNLIKAFSKANKRPLITFNNRFFASYEEPKLVSDQEVDAALEIETRLFNNSSVKYEPVKKEEVLKYKKVKFSKKTARSDISSNPKQIPSFKKSRLKREVESNVVNDEELGVEFLKLNLNDPRLSSLLITARSKKRRDKNREIVIEGRRLIQEALACGLKLNNVIFSRKDQLLDIRDNIVNAQKLFKTKIYKVPHHDFKTWSTLTTPPGVMAIFERPTHKSMDDKISSETTALPITVVCDNIREPNNLGSIIRVCAAIPCQQIIVTRGCCDPWESKALRGGCGGHFRLAIQDDVDWQEIPLLIPREVVDNCFIFVAENNIKKLQNSLTVAEYSDLGDTGLHNVVIIGGESHGVSPDAYRLMATVGQRGKCLNIPLAQGIESLNVVSALTLILYELRKNILKSNEIQM